MNYSIIQSNSKGNATVIENILLLDCGVSFKKLSPYCRNLKAILLTHIHADHFNKTTIKKIAKERPTLKFICCEWLKEELSKLVSRNNIIIVKIGEETNLNIFKVVSIKAYHDVSNCGYRIYINDKKVLYMTDTEHLEGITAKGYDLYLLESNYGEEELQKRIEEKTAKGEFIYERRASENHLSKEQCDKFLLDNMGENSKYEYMHEHMRKIYEEGDKEND